MEAILGIVRAALEALGALFGPAVVEAITGGQSVEEALAAARAATDGVPRLGGTDGAWAAEDAAQDARIREKD